MRLTPWFGLLVIEPGDDPYSLGHKFFTADRDLIDSLLHRTLSGHVHDGGSPSTATPADPPELTLDTSPSSGGAIPAGSRIWYTYSLVSQDTGDETQAAPSAFIDTPDPLSPPAVPGLAWGSTGGSLLPGQYAYVLSAWVSANTNETNALSPAAISIPVGTVTNRIVVTFPATPAGAQGFNIYRRKPGGRSYDFIDSVDLNVATPPTEYIDDGILEDCDRLAPKVNTTNSTNAIEVGYPTATPTVPPGFTWKIYRTVNQDDWTMSVLHHVVEETFDLSGIITPVFLDTGGATLTGAPTTSGQNIANPAKILLTDGAEVQGTLPPSMVAYHVTIDWMIPGEVIAGAGLAAWRCPYDQFLIERVGLNLSPVAAPASVDIIVDVNKWDENIAIPAWGTIYTNQSNRPRVLVGEFIGTETVPDVVTLLRNDFLSYDVDQDGGGATPTDADLAVQIVGWAFVNEPTSVVFP